MNYRKEKKEERGLAKSPVSNAVNLCLKEAFTVNIQCQYVIHSMCLHYILWRLRKGWSFFKKWIHLNQYVRNFLFPLANPLCKGLLNTIPASQYIKLFPIIWFKGLGKWRQVKLKAKRHGVIHNWRSIRKTLHIWQWGPKLEAS